MSWKLIYYLDILQNLNYLLCIIYNMIYIFNNAYLVKLYHTVYKLKPLHWFIGYVFYMLMLVVFFQIQGSNNLIILYYVFCLKKKIKVL